MGKDRVTGDTQRVHCNQCRGLTWHKLLKLAEDRGSEEIETVGPVSWVTTFAMLQCRGCCEVVLRRSYWFSENDEEEVRYFPPVVSRHPPEWRFKLPHNLRLLLEEVYTALDADNRRLPMMGARALVDMVMVEKIGDVGSFKAKLMKLESEGFVSSKNRYVLEAALDAGSAAAHRGHAAKTPEVLAVMDIVENLLQAVYVLREAAQKLQKSTPPRPPRQKGSS